GAGVAPPAGLDGRPPGPAGAGQVATAAAAPVAPRHQAQSALVPDRQDGQVIAEQELDLALAAAFVSTACDVGLFEKSQGQAVPGQSDTAEHGRLRLVGAALWELQDGTGAEEMPGR